MVGIIILLLMYSAIKYMAWNLANDEIRAAWGQANVASSSSAIYQDQYGDCYQALKKKEREMGRLADELDWWKHRYGQVDRYGRVTGKEIPEWGNMDR